MKPNHPVGYGPSQRVDVRGQGCIELQMPGRVIADNVDDRGVSAARVVQVGHSVGETWTQVKKRQSRRSADTCIAVSRTCAYALKQAQDGPDSRDLIQCTHQSQ